MSVGNLYTHINLIRLDLGYVSADHICPSNGSPFTCYYYVWNIAGTLSTDQMETYRRGPDVQDLSVLGLGLLSVLFFMVSGVTLLFVVCPNHKKDGKENMRSFQQNDISIIKV